MADQAALEAIKAMAQQPPAHVQQVQGHPNHLLQLLTMLMQGADAFNTSDFLKKPGTYETDPLMKPFAKGGDPMPMLGVYGAEDEAISGMPTAGRQNTANFLQLLLNLAGILRTDHAKQTGH